jgi:hypothetical protein
VVHFTFSPWLRTQNESSLFAILSSGNELKRIEKGDVLMFNKISKLAVVGALALGLTFHPGVQGNAYAASSSCSSSYLVKEGDKQIEMNLKEVLKMIRDGKMTIKEFAKYYLTTVKDKMNFVKHVSDCTFS